MDYITKATSKLNFQAVSESTVQRLLLSLNPRKSTGIDKIPAKIIRVASPVVANSYNLRGSTTKLYLPKPKT